MKIQDSETAIPFNDLIIALFDKREDKKFLNDICKFVKKHKKDYSLVHLYTLNSCIKGYLNHIHCC